MNPQYPLVFSTLLIRLAVGIAIVHIVTSLGGTAVVKDWLVAVFSIGCIVLGVILSMTHLGKPQRFLNSFANPKSMLTLEAYFMPLLIGSMFLLAIGSYFSQAAWLTGIGKIG
ncbi:MAG: dimethyl sulfoxide reductase anchor subunit, partial [Deltaproteobacteria bacterium]|nr:dimethyl sulfoxide reductase anchor subunit [Deltaproteobacteria bacterium]